jgi:subtilase family serine protease
MRGKLFSFLIRSVFAAGLVCVGLLAQGQDSAQGPLITQLVDEARLTRLWGNTHPLARSEFDLGTAPATLPMERMLLVLKRSAAQEASLRKLLDDQQDKASPNYHHWLTPKEFGEQFGARDSDMQTITSWLQSHGFHVGSTKGRTVLEFSGTASQVQEAFHTTIHKYIVNGEQHWANASDPMIPSALTGAVAGVASLNNFPRKAMNKALGGLKLDKSTGKLFGDNPQVTEPGQCTPANECYGLGPYDFATIYNVAPLWNSGIDGTGVTIAISGETDIQKTDVEAFRSVFGLPANDPVFVYNGPDPGIQGDESEADIDVQWSGAVAKGATIDFVISQSTETTSGVDLSAVYIVDQDLAPIMSESYGECELGLGTAGNQFYNALWQQAAAEGITVFISAGDAGSAGCDNFNAQPPAPAEFGLQASGYASTPYNVAVGGTDFNDFSNSTQYWSSTNQSGTLQSALSYIPETTWNDSCTNSIFGTLGFSTNPETNCNNSRLVNFVNVTGGSGGVSACTTPSGQTPASCAGGYPRPSWQTGKGTFSNDGKRDLPDVSLFASNGFVGEVYLVCEADIGFGCQYGNYAGFGGTSVSSPAFAGIMALVDQQYGRQGNANYIFYKLAQKSGASCTSSASEATSCIFNDVTVGTNAGPCMKGSPNCVTNTSSDQYGVLSGYNAVAGYDMATGLGSVNAANLLNQWGSVMLLGSTTTLSGPNPTTTQHGQPVTFGVTVKPESGAGTPTGQIALVAGTQSRGVTNLALSNGSASGSTALLPGGSYSISAHYAGDGTYMASDSTPVAVDVTAESSQVFPNLVTFDSSGHLTSFTANSATYGSGYYLFRVDVGDASASESSTKGVLSSCSQGKASCPTGTISIQASGTTLNGTSLSLNSKGFTENQSFPPGTFTVSAHYSGDASYSASTETASFTVAAAPTTLSVGPATITGVQYGNFTQIGADVITTSDGSAPTGTFQFIQDGSPLGSPQGVYESGPYNPNNGSYAWADTQTTTHFNSVGNHTLSAEYSGDAYYAPSTSPTSTYVVAQAQPFFNSYGWETYNENVYVGQTVTARAQLYGSQYGALPTGGVTMFDNNVAFPGPVTYSQYNGMLVATSSYTFTTPGTHLFTATYAGDMNYLPATITSPQTITVLGPVSVTTGSQMNIASPGQSGSTILTLTANQGFTGTVSLSCTAPTAAKESTCGFTNGSTTGATLQVDLEAASTTVTFNVITTAPHNSAALTSGATVLGTLGLGLIGILLLPGRRFRRMLPGAVMLICLTTLLLGCGGGSSGGGGGGGGFTDQGTPPGTYSFTVTSTTGSGSTAISVTTPVTVTVQ